MSATPKHPIAPDARGAHSLHRLVGALPWPQACARIEALQEAADHLDLQWTDVPLEREEGTLISAALRETADLVYKLRVMKRPNVAGERLPAKNV